MKNIFLGMLAIALMASPSVYANGGKKKARKKAKVECTKDKCCDSKACCKDDKCPPMPTCGQ
jgi:hypothetical protein